MARQLLYIELNLDNLLDVHRLITSKGKEMKNKLILASILMLGCVNSAFALNALQLGPGTGGTWVYDGSEETWVTNDTSLDLNAYANCDSSVYIGCNGDYAWADGDTTRYAYLVAAAVPSTDTDPAFSLSIENDGGALTMLDSGYGAPPLSDDNSLSPHGIYDTYFQIYEFQFDGSLGLIGDTQPGETGTGLGYTETLSIAINSLALGVEGVHFDLFSIDGGRYVVEGTNIVDANAPFSHDAEYHVPAPGAAFLFGLGLLALVGMRKKVA